MKSITDWVMLLLFLFLGGFCAYKTLDIHQMNKRFEHEAKTAMAYPTSSEYTEKRRRFFFKTLSTDLAFKDETNHVVHLHKADISKEELAALQKGDSIAREYLADRPEDARKPGDTSSIWWTGGIALFSLVSALGYIMSFFSKDDEGEAPPLNPSEPPPLPPNSI